MHIVNQPNKILLISTQLFGDGLLTTGISHSLRQAYPDCQIDVLTSRNSNLAFEGNPDIDNIIYLPKKPNKTQAFEFIKKYWRRYDISINERVSDRTAIYSLITGRYRVGAINKNNSNAFIKKWIYHYWIEEPCSKTHRFQRNMQLLDNLNIEKISGVIAPEPSLFNGIHDLPENYLVLHCPASSDFKQWPAKHWQQLAYQLAERNCFMVFTGSKAERDVAIIQSVKKVLKPDTYIDLSGQLTIPQLGSVFKNSLGFIGSDTGPAHLASAYPVPQVVLFGPTPPSQWAPWPYKQSVDSPAFKMKSEEQTLGNITILQSGLKCTPCYAKLCEITQSLQPECLNQLTPEKVIQAIDTHILKLPKEGEIRNISTVDI